MSVRSEIRYRVAPPPAGQDSTPPTSPFTVYNFRGVQHSTTLHLFNTPFSHDTSHTILLGVGPAQRHTHSPAKVSIRFRFVAENPLSPGDSFCSSVAICSKTLLPQAISLVLVLILFPILKYKSTRALFTDFAARYRLLRMVSF